MSRKDERKPEISRWKGPDRMHANYRCRMCGFTTLHRAKFEDHIRLAHPSHDAAASVAADDQSAGETGKEG